ncbi:MAG: hypothetical protein AAF682_30610 [Planctomycetota bacterium]
MGIVKSPTRRLARRGYTFLEITISVALFVLIFGSLIAVLSQDQTMTKTTVTASGLENSASRMLFWIERELANASGATPSTTVTAEATPGASSVRVSSTVGFPPAGILLINRGEPNEETLSYAGLDPDAVLFLDCDRGLQCTTEAKHELDSEVLWGGLAEPLDQQAPPPPASTYDGIALEAEGPVYFRGQGTGFSYRIPVDPDGGQDFLDGDELKLGATVPEVGPTLDGWMAIYFQPRNVYVEADRGFDVNGDGDAEDEFDVGHLRQVSWDVSNPDATPRDVAVGPANVLQERCNYASDLDSDGFEDPMFLWNQETNELHVRLFLIRTSTSEPPVTRTVDSVVFLRNEPEM